MREATAPADQKRNDVIVGLRSLADLLDATPALPVSEFEDVSVYVTLVDVDQFAETVRLLGDRVDLSIGATTVTARATLGPTSAYIAAIDRARFADALPSVEQIREQLAVAS